MRTITRVILVMAIFSLSQACKKEKEDVLIPQWLDELIQARKNDPFYMGAAVYRYHWNSAAIYEFEIPLSSCLYCEVYFEDGENINWEENNLEDYIENRSDKIRIWYNPYLPD
jgi:hypothetical protein